MSAFEDWLDGEIQQINEVIDGQDLQALFGSGISLSAATAVNGRRRALQEARMAYKRLAQI